MGNKLTYAFRMVHISNIPHILEHGFVHKNSPYASKNYIPIGDTSVIEKRIQRNILGSKSLNDYIPFYFGPRTPMLYVVQKGYNGVQQHPPEDIVYCVIRIQDIINHKISCCFSDGHALTYITRFYDQDKLQDIDNYIKLGDVYAEQWQIEEDRDLKRRKEAELLLEDEIPFSYIKGFVVYNEAAKERLQTLGIDHNKIIIRPNYYF